MKSTNPVVSELLNLAAKLRAKRPQLEKRLAELDAKIKSIETTLELYADEKKIGFQRQHVSANDIRGLTQIEALKKIAGANGGLVNASDAKRLFIAAHLSTGKPKNLGPHIYAILKSSPSFKWESPGTFRLVNGDHQPTLLKVQDANA
jgi:hypothetical protein